MRDFPLKKLDALCAPRIESLKPSFEGLIDYIDISSVDNKAKEVVSFQTIDAEEAPSRAKQLIEDRDILVSSVRPNLNAVAVYDGQCKNLPVCSTGYCVLRCSDSLYYRYLFYFCQSFGFIDGLVRLAKGASYPAVSNSDIRNALIPLPQIKEQKKIASELDAVSEVLRLRKAQLAELDNLVKSQFIEMFGDPTVNPMKWETLKLVDCYDIVDGDRGINYPKSADFSDTGYCLFLNAGNVTKAGFCFEEKQFISSKKDRELRKGKLVRGDIVLTTRGTVGNFAYYSNNVSFENMRINSGMVILRDKGTLTPQYFFALFQPELYKPYMSGTAQPQMPISSMRNIQIVNPPKALQNKFSDFVNQIDHNRSDIQQSLDETQRLFDSLMAEYFEA